MRRIEPPAAPEAQEVSEEPGWLAQPEPPARGEARRDRTLLDLLPVGVLIYRLDRLLYANPAFLERMGYPSLHALEEAGGLDALYVEPGVSTASSTSDTGTPVTICAPQAPTEHAPAATIDARLYTISLGRRLRAGADLLRRSGGKRRYRRRDQRGYRRRPNLRRSATPMPRNSAPSSIPRPRAS